MRRKLKNFLAAIVITILAIGYYSWMFPAWNRLTEPANDRDVSPRQYAFNEVEIVDDEPVEETSKQSEEIVFLNGISRQEKPKQKTFTFDEYPMPQSAYFIAYPRHKCDSVLAINTAKGASYVIKLVDVQNEEDILTYFLPGGVRREIDVLSGDFELRYTCGTRWYGVEKLFGPNAAYVKADCIFYFREGSGYEVTLYGVKDGNLRTIAISGEDF